MVNKSFVQNSAFAGGKYCTLFVILGFALFFSGCAGKPVVTVKNEAEAVKIIDVLREYDISAKKEEVTENNVRQFKILVDGEEAGAAAFQILNAHCLPQTEPPPVESSSLSSPDVDRAKIQRQQKMNIVAQLRSLPGATCVDINYSLSQDPLEAVTQPYPARAAVTLRHKTQEVPYNEAEVRELVSGMVTNLKSENVTVKFIYEPIPAPERSKGNSLTRILLIGGVALAVVLGSVFLVYFLRKRNQNGSTALAERVEEVEAAETVQ